MTHSLHAGLLAMMELDDGLDYHAISDPKEPRMSGTDPENTPDGGTDNTGHLCRDGLPPYFRALEQGGNALDVSLQDDITMSFRQIGNRMWMAATPGPVVELTVSDAELVSETLANMRRAAMNSGLGGGR